MILDRMINGLQVRAEYHDADVRDILLPLLQTMTSLHREKGQRILVFLAAPPATGKSTLAAVLQELSGSEGFDQVTALGMDGFHLSGAYLSTHMTELDGETVPMTRIKGAPETYDTEKLAERLKALASGKNVCWPVYDRQIHDPVEGTVPVEGEILLIEGNYLLLDDPAYARLRCHADLTIAITADEELLRARLIDRKTRGYGSREEAERFVDTSDMRNVRLVLNRSVQADIELSVTSDGRLIRTK